jgi:hypothetical protein
VSLDLYFLDLDEPVTAEDIDECLERPMFLCQHDSMITRAPAEVDPPHR